LVNLIAEEKVVAECVQKKMNAKNLSNEIISLLDTKRIENHFSLNLYNWQNALKRCLKRIKYCEGE